MYDPRCLRIGEKGSSPIRGPPMISLRGMGLVWSIRVRVVAIGKVMASLLDVGLDKRKRPFLQRLRCTVEVGRNRSIT